MSLQTAVPVSSHMPEHTCEDIMPLNKTFRLDNPSKLVSDEFPSDLYLNSCQIQFRRWPHLTRHEGHLFGGAAGGDGCTSSLDGSRFTGFTPRLERLRGGKARLTWMLVDVEAGQSRTLPRYEHCGRMIAFIYLILDTRVPSGFG